MSDELEDEISALAALAIEGDNKAAKRFYEQLLKANLLVPTRKQANNLSDSPQYPNELLDILGVQSKTDDRVFVPVFSNPSFISKWCGTELNSRSMSLRELSDILPEEWWVVINPGQSVEKELSPWELKELKDGAKGIEAILEDYGAQYEADSPTIKELPLEIFNKLQAAIHQLCLETKEVTKVYGAVEEKLTNSEDSALSTTILIAAKINSDRASDILQSLEHVIAKAMIGDFKIKMVPISSAGKAFLENVLSQYKPLFERRSFLEKILGR